MPAAAFVGFPGLDPTASLTVVKQREDIKSAFGALTWNATSRLRFNVGVRYSSVLKKADRSVIIGRVPSALAPGFDGEVPTPQNVVPDPLPAQGALGAFLNAPLGNFLQPKLTTNRLLPSASIQYKITPDLMTYVSYARGFKAGGFAVGSRDEFQPEKVDDYEAGVKATWLERRLTTDITVFRGDYDNLQTATIVQSAAGIPSSTIGNVGRSRSQGVEGDIRFVPSRGLTIAASIAYLHARYLKYPNAPCPAIGGTGCTQDLAGKVHAFAPEVTLGGSVDYLIPINDRLNLKLGASLQYSSKYFLADSLDLLLKEGPYAKVDLRAGIAGLDGRWDLSVIARNVTDRATAATLQNTIPTTSGSHAGVTDPPRTVVLQLAIHWP